MKEQKTQKILQIDAGGLSFVGVRQLQKDGKPIKLYVKWYDGKTHRRGGGEFPDLVSMLSFLTTLSVIQGRE